MGAAPSHSHHTAELSFVLRDTQGLTAHTKRTIENRFRGKTWNKMKNWMNQLNQPSTAWKGKRSLKCLNILIHFDHFVYFCLTFRILSRPHSPCVQPLGCQGCPQSPQGCRFHRRRFHPEAGDKGPFEWWVSLSYLEYILGYKTQLTISQTFHRTLSGIFYMFPLKCWLHSCLHSSIIAWDGTVSGNVFICAWPKYPKSTKLWSKLVQSVGPVRCLSVSDVSAWMAGCKVLVRDWMPAPQVALHLETRLVETVPVEWSKAFKIFKSHSKSKIS